MIELFYLQVFFLIVLILSMTIFIIPLIIIRRKGKDPHGTHGDTSHFKFYQSKSCIST